MVLIKDQIIRQIAPLIVHGRENTNIYFVGSLSDASNNSFNPRLSDIDLLFTPVCTSLEDYVSNFEQAMRINAILNQPSDRLVESFVMSSRMAPYYFKILPVLAGGLTLDAPDLAFGKGVEINQATISAPANEGRRNLYRAKSLQFCDEYAYALPIADTSRARRTAKMLLRGMMFMICANVAPDKLSQTEAHLLKMETFEEVASVFLKTYNHSFTGDLALLQKTLNGDTVEDWAAWMTVQEGFAQLLMEVNHSEKLSVATRRFYMGLSQTRDLLYRELKNIISTEMNSHERNVRIGEFADNTASAVVKLALSGVAVLEDLESDDTPSIVKEGYGVLVEHLRGEAKGLLVLGASVAVLEYAFEKSVAAHDMSR